MSFVKQSPDAPVACRSCNTTSTSGVNLQSSLDHILALVLYKTICDPPQSCVCGSGPVVGYCYWRRPKGVFLCRECWECHQSSCTYGNFYLALDVACAGFVYMKEDLTSLQSDAKLCKLHPDQKLGFFCMDCATLLCVKCIQTNVSMLEDQVAPSEQSIYVNIAWIRSICIYNIITILFYCDIVTN